MRLGGGAVYALLRVYKQNKTYIFFGPIDHLKISYYDVHRLMKKLKQILRHEGQP